MMHRGFYIVWLPGMKHSIRMKSKILKLNCLPNVGLRIQGYTRKQLMPFPNFGHFVSPALVLLLNQQQHRQSATTFTLCQREATPAKRRQLCSMLDKFLDICQEKFSALPLEPSLAQFYFCRPSLPLFSLYLLRMRAHSQDFRHRRHAEKLGRLRRDPRRL